MLEKAVEQSIVQAISGDVADFREIEKVAKYLAMTAYSPESVVPIATSVEQKQRMGYIAEVADEFRKELKITNTSTMRLKNKLLHMLEHTHLEPTHFTPHQIPVELLTSNAYSQRWNVVSDFTERDMLTHSHYSLNQ